MRTSVVLLCIAMGLPSARTAERWAGDDPRWLTALIRVLESLPVANPPAYIARYEYRGDTVYYLPPRCCDIPSNVYNAAGAIICHADGGFAGDGDGRCADFHTARKNAKIIWRDPRAKKRA